MKRAEVKRNGVVVWSQGLGENEKFIPREELTGELLEEAKRRHKLTRISSKQVWLGIIVHKSGNFTVVHMDDRKRSIR